MKTQDIALNVYINANDAGTGMRKLQKEAAGIRKEMEKLTPGTQEYINKAKRLGDLDKTFDNHKKSIAGIRAEATKLRNQIANGLIPGTNEYNKAVNRLRGLNGQIQAHNNAIRGVGGAWDTVKKGLLGVMPSIIAITGVTALFEGAKNLMKSNADLSDSYADVMKTTGMTRGAVEDLYGSFKEFNTRTSRHELMELSKVAGKLGITGVKNVKDFVKAADMINVALGEDLGDIDTVVRNLGALNNLFKLDEMYGTADAMMKVGSAINSVGASGTAREASLVDFTSRVGGAANSVGLLVDEVIGYGAVLDEAMVASETSSTSISQFWMMMGKDAQKFAGIAGMATADFKKLMAEDFNEAFILVLEGLKSTGGGIEELALSMEGADVNGARMIQSLNALANNTDKLREKQELSRKEFEKGTSLSDEFAVKNENLAAKLERVQRAFSAMFTNSWVLKGFEKLVGLADDYVKVNLSDTLEKERIELNVLVSQLIRHNGNQERRKELIKEIQDKYPDFLANIDLEKASMITLAAALKNYNEEMLSKIALQALDEKIAAERKKQGELEADRVIWEEKMQRKIIEGEEILGITIDKNLSLEQQRIALDKARFDNYDRLSHDQVKRLSKINSDLKVQLEDPWFGAKDFQGEINKIQVIIDQYEAARKKLDDQINSRIIPKDTEGWMDDKFTPRSGPAPEKEKDKPKDLTDEEKKRLEEQLKATQKMLDELAIMRIEAMTDEREREIAMAQHKSDMHKREVLDSKANAETKKEMLVAIEQALINEVSAINDKHFHKKQKDDEARTKEELKKAQELENARKSFREKVYEQEFRELEAVAQLKVINTKEGTRERIEAEQELLLLQADWAIRTTVESEAERLLIMGQTNEAITKLWEDFNAQAEKWQGLLSDEQKKKMHEVLDSGMQVLTAAQDIANMMHDLRMAEIDAERAALEEKLAAQDEAHEREKAQAEEAYNDKRISREEYDTYLRQLDGQYSSDRQAQMDALDKKAKKMEAEAAARTKKIKLAMAVVNVAAGIATALGSAPPPINFINAAAVGIAGAVEIATIAKTPIPKFAKGGATTFDSFANGGNVNSTRLGIIGEKGPEWVAPNWMLTNPATANIIGMLEDMRLNKQHYATGGTTAPRAQAGPASSSTTLGMTPNSTDPEMKMLLQKLLARLDEPIVAKTHIGNRGLLEMNEEMEKLKTSQSRGKA